MLAFGVTLDALVASFFCAVLVVISAIDLEHKIIPNRIVMPAFGIVLAAQTLLHPSPQWALAALGASGFLFVAAVVYPAGMGMGDVKLALLLGAMLGRVVPVGLMLGMLLALIPSVYLLARHGGEGPEDGLPLRAVPGPGRDFGPVLGRSAPGGVSEHSLAAESAQHFRRLCR